MKSIPSGEGSGPRCNRDGIHRRADLPSSRQAELVVEPQPRAPFLLDLASELRFARIRSLRWRSARSSRYERTSAWQCHDSDAADRRAHPHVHRYVMPARALGDVRQSALRTRSLHCHACTAGNMVRRTEDGSSENDRRRRPECAGRDSHAAPGRFAPAWFGFRRLLIMGARARSGSIGTPSWRSSSAADRRGRGVASCRAPDGRRAPAVPGYQS